MSVDREQIITSLSEGLRQNPRVLAVWLEGADATRNVDEYSDIDLCCSVEAGGLAEIPALAQAASERLGQRDLAHVLHDQASFQHITYHLAGTSDYLLVDFCVYAAGRGSQFVEGDEIERPLVLFDRGNVIQYRTPEEELARHDNGGRLQELRDTVAQYARLDKVLKRGEFLEAFGYYHKWLLTPLIEALRMRYTPLHTDYYIVHISRHLPPAVRERMESLFQVNSVAEIESKSREALRFFSRGERGSGFVGCV